MTQGYFMEALMDFSVAIKLEKDRKDNAERNENQGMVSSGNKEKDKIHEYYRNAGQANYELAQYNEALQHFESAVRGAPSGHDYFNRGLTNMKLGDYENADADFKLGQATIKKKYLTKNVHKTVTPPAPRPWISFLPYLGKFAKKLSLLVEF